MGTRGHSSSDFVFVMNSDGVLLHLSLLCTSYCTQQKGRDSGNKQNYMGKTEMPGER